MILEKKSEAMNGHIKAKHAIYLFILLDHVLE